MSLSISSRYRFNSKLVGETLFCFSFFTLAVKAFLNVANGTHICYEMGLGTVARLLRRLCFPQCVT